MGEESGALARETTIRLYQLSVLLAIFDYLDFSMKTCSPRV